MQCYRYTQYFAGNITYSKQAVYLYKILYNILFKCLKYIQLVFFGSSAVDDNKFLKF